MKKLIAGSREEELEFEFMTMLLLEQIMACPFCRAPEPTNDKELLKRLWNQIDEYKDLKAMNILGDVYFKGKYGR